MSDPKQFLCPRCGLPGDVFAVLDLGADIGFVRIIAPSSMDPEKVLELTEILIRLRREERARKGSGN